MELLSRAIRFAVDAHDGMRRKGGDSPYILHPIEAAAIVGSMTDDQSVIAAAVLHDVVEDTGISLAEIEKEFGQRISDLVKSETEDKLADLPPTSTWKIRKEASLKVLEKAEDDAVLMVWIGDKLANMRSFYREWQLKGDDIWQKFNQQDPEQHAWYYRNIAVLTEKLSSHWAWQEYNTLVEKVFGRGE